MSFIEGIGDDFLYAILFLIFIGIISLAWFSTYVNQIHLPPTVFIIERRTQRRNDEQLNRIDSSLPSRLTLNNEQISSLPSNNDIHTEQEQIDNEFQSNETEEFDFEQQTTESLVDQQLQCEHSSSPSTEQQHTQTIRITIKFLNETRKEILVNPNDTISKVKQLHFADDLAHNKMIRFIYQGRELQDHQTLETYNIHDQTTIHCQITTRHIQTINSSTNHRTSTHITNRTHHTFDASTLIDTSPVNISSYFIFFLSLILGFIWYLRIKYRLLFSPISTVVLILITFLFLIFTCGSLLTSRRILTNSRSATITIAPVQQHEHID